MLTGRVRLGARGCVGVVCVPSEDSCERGRECWRGDRVGIMSLIHQKQSLLSIFEVIF